MEAAGGIWGWAWTGVGQDWAAAAVGIYMAAAVGICGGGGWDLARGQDCVAAAAVGGPGGQGGSGSRHIDCPCSVPGAAGRNCKSSVTAPPPITKYNYHVVVLTCRGKRVNGSLRPVKQC